MEAHGRRYREHMLFTPFQLGRLQLPNRVVMSPMTRSRAPGNVPGERQARYYAQRATAGLIITEGTSPSPNGLGYARIPGAYSREQAAGWKLVADAVHAAGGRIFVQLMHTGRIAHPANMPAGSRVLAPSAIAAPGQMYTDTAGMQAHPVPEAMTADDIAVAIAEHAQAAQLLVGAGIDGVELHGANGYLIEQFLNGAANHRTDAYGERTRFAVEVARAVAAEIGGDRVGMRVSPYGVNGGLTADDKTDATYLELAAQLSQLGLAYIHVANHSSMGAPPVPESIQRGIRETFRGAYILSGGYDRARAEADLEARRGDLVAFGRPFLANPDLVAKLSANAELLPANPATFFTPGDEGYLV